MLASLKREKHEKDKREYEKDKQEYADRGVGSLLDGVILEHEAYTEGCALVMIMEQGKTNQYGRREFRSCIWHRNVEVCPIEALGFYLCYRWSVQTEDVPNFLVPEEWYDVKVRKAGKNRTTPWTYRVTGLHETLTVTLIG
ncbi:hypothetical protein PHMEG_00040110 [Phytophthora megakarya]|uniref:Ndc10 domain-containing protein n=1 Tax=Phytophthora megakarya TaxID=4795 RepID=A0A225UE60_9STRA|nr:hypothetical protein PHMEG_00040110 [Phytophthora megakarya]